MPSGDLEGLRKNLEASLEPALAKEALKREAHWTESLCGAPSRLRRENPAIDFVSERNRLDRRALRMGAEGRGRFLQREKGLGNCFQGLAKARNSAEVLRDQMLASAAQELEDRMPLKT